MEAKSVRLLNFTDPSHPDYFTKVPEEKRYDSPPIAAIHFPGNRVIFMPLKVQNHPAGQRQIVERGDIMRD